MVQLRPKSFDMAKRFPGLLDPKRLREQWREIKEVQSRVKVKRGPAPASCGYASS